MDEPQRRSDGAQTHAVILEAALRLASIEGLSSLTIGRLAREVGVSRSGVFAHFRSKQRLQQETIAAAQEVFEREVVRPGLDAPRGSPSSRASARPTCRMSSAECSRAGVSSRSCSPSSTRPTG